MKAGKLILIILFVTGLTVFSSCAVQHVKPWERDQLAQKKMQLIHDPTENGIDEHIYFSKEASNGGKSVGGGGCGCN